MNELLQFGLPIQLNLLKTFTNKPLLSLLSSTPINLKVSPFIIFVSPLYKFGGLYLKKVSQKISFGELLVIAFLSGAISS